MKRTAFTLAAALLAAAAGARPVAESTARQVAANFLNSTPLAGLPLTLTQHPSYAPAPQHSTYFAYNAGAAGFIIVAGDDALHPVLAYSTESRFDASNMPAPAAAWLERYGKYATAAMDQQLAADEQTAGEWEALLSATASKTTGTSIVQELLTTRWGQNAFYNSACPVDNSAAAPSLTGCVATSMAQIMRYWKHPLTGAGTNSYVPIGNSQIGTQSVDFAAASYNWSLMPAVVSNNNGEVAKLMYHAGVSVSMRYSATFSGAFVISYGGQVDKCAEHALVENFGYKGGMEGVERDFMEPGRNWLPMLKMEMNGSRPVIYAGFGPAAGHAFVADGYDLQDRLHVNWGLNGSMNGYFLADAMNPTPSVSFNDAQEALIGIEPAHSAVNLELLRELAMPTTIGYMEPFTLKTYLFNSGTDTFRGDYALRIFDTLGNVVDSIGTMPNQSLEAGMSTNGLNFVSHGNANMHPGVYWAGVYYRSPGGRWRQAGDDIVPNLITVTVANNVGTPQTSLRQPGIRVWPLPAADELRVMLPVSAELVLLDLQGRTLQRKEAGAGVESRFPVAQLPGGVYQLRVRSAAGVETRKVLVRH